MTTPNPLLVLAIRLTTDPNSCVTPALSQTFTKVPLQVLEGRNTPELTQGQGDTFHYCALTRLLSVWLSLERPDRAQGSLKVTIHTSWLWRMTEARSKQASDEKQRRRGAETDRRLRKKLKNRMRLMFLLAVRKEMCMRENSRQLALASN